MADGLNLRRIEFKDHNHRQLVNDLRDIALAYHGTQQLRARIEGAVGQFFDANEVRATPPAPSTAPSDELPPGLQQCGWMYIDDDGYGPHLTESEKYANRYLHNWPIYKKAPADGHVCDYKLAYGCCSQCAALANKKGTPF